MTTQQTPRELGNTALLKGLRAHLQPLAGDARQYDGLMALIGRARVALLGEASHGTPASFGLKGSWRTRWCSNCAK